MIYILLLFVTIVFLLIYLSDKKKLKDQSLLLKKIEAAKNLEMAGRVLLEDWCVSKITMENIIDYLKAKGYERVAIYGLSRLGIYILDEIYDAGIPKVYGIDKTPKYSRDGINILRTEEFDTEVDIIIVVTVYYFSEIYDDLRARLGQEINIVGLDELLSEISEQKEKGIK